MVNVVTLVKKQYVKSSLMMDLAHHTFANMFIVQNLSAWCNYLSPAETKWRLWRHCGLVVRPSGLVSGLSVLGSHPCQDHCFVFLGKTLNSQSASLHPGV